jgi:acyl carrier protein
MEKVRASMATREDVLGLFEAADIRVPPSDLTDDAPLAQQGLDSLDMTNLLFQIEQKYQVTIAPRDAARLRSIQAMVDFIDALSGAAARVGAGGDGRS